DEITDLLPSGGARVLITSRFSDWGAWADEIPLDVLSLTQAAAFLQSRSGHSDHGGAQQLAEALERLPLALDHAAPFSKHTQMPFAAYAADASKLMSHVPRGVSYPKSVIATFDLAIGQAVAQCAAARDLMAYLAQCAPERIPITLAEGAVDN